MKICLLGGGNVYALSLAELLNERGIEHFGIGRSPRKHFWVEHHYKYYKLHLIDQFEAVLAVLDTERPDYIINFAAQGEGQGSFSNPVPFYETNTTGLVRLVEELRVKEYCSRFVQIGTSELYGSVEAPSKETDPIKPTSPYAVSKAAFDLHLEIMGRLGFPSTIVRPSNCYCPRQQLHRIIPKSIIYALSGKTLPLQGGGRSKKTYLHASDLSRAILILLTSEPGIYNCGAERPVEIREVVRLCAEICGKSLEELVNITDDRVGQDGCYWLDSSKLKSLGWEPTVDLTEGVTQMVTWVKDNPEILSMSTDWKILR